MKKEKQMHRKLRISDIFQKSRYHFVIHWSDGKKQIYRLSMLQQHCPCVRCIEMRAKQRAISVDSAVLAVRIVSVGRYALRVEFTSGCSEGIYPFSLLQVIGEVLC